ncbi:MAG TPA: FecR domain-containing protein [Vicinamibacteria bacterium]|nr:FecR domain-containing protein [Vicinamibacteria bacterium]
MIWAVLGLPAAAQEFATLEAVRGRVTVIRLGQPQDPPPFALLVDDIVVTKEGRATVRFRSDGSVLRIGPDSRVQINETATERKVSLFVGRLWAHVVRWKERPTRFATSSTIAAVRGTELSLGVAVDGDETQIALLEGAVDVETDAGKLAMQGGQTAVGKKGQPPVRSVKVRPVDAVSWALYYPPVTSFDPRTLPEGPAASKVRESAEALRKGDLAGAIASLEGVDSMDIKEARFFSYRASLLLAAGKVEGASRDLEQSLKLVAVNSDALALQAAMAVATNDVDKALELSKRAVAANSKSAAAHIARSYALQAGFDLEGARSTLETAVKVDPQAALAWARLAEIRSSQGHLDAALEAARQAAALEADLSRTQTVLGYAYLTQVKTREAKEAFAKAAELDKADPLPRLGLGLARIREGELAEGTREIEVAASLDPGQSIVRSYLGKAYFEARRGPLDAREYDVAKQLDAKDPTPWLYDAIAKQTTNRPVDALRSFEQAIDLNDNRAVYRSRLLLDSDLAARSASLGRIYGDLGFQSLGLVEGWNSVAADPGDHSGHRLLADNYAALPRHEIARVSELFQSQMLQPLNTTPIQPRLGESSLLLIAGGGPSALAFNEFNPLFNRDQIRAQATFLAGEQSTYTGEGIISGIYKKLSFSAGYSGFQTDGWRENGDQDDKIANAFVQAELSPSTSVQAEYRYRDTETGDLRMRFFADDFFPGERRKTERNTLRGGLRHAFAPGSTLLASVMYQDLEATRADDQPPFPEIFSGDAEAQDALGVEAQYLYRSRRVALTAGAGLFDIDHSLETTVTVHPDFIPPPDNTFVIPVDLSLKHTDFYAYSYLKPVEQFTATVGLSADLLRADTTAAGDRDQWNPKFGLTWKPAAGTTVRGAAFRSLKRTLITDQTLEPTQVAGFNQFYDDINGTRAWRYGGAIDQKLGDAFVGAEFSKRDLEIPFFSFDEETGEAFSELEEASERLARAYLYVTPHSWFAVRAEYSLEKFESEGVTDLPVELTTHRLPLAISFFHPAGLSASVTATLFDQEGEFVRIGGIPESGSDDFWTVDVALSYRLPKRYGFLAVGATNLFDEDFNYFDTDVRNPVLQPTRRIYARVVVAF